MFRVSSSYSFAQAYELISQFRLISSNFGVVHSMVPPPFTCRFPNSGFTILSRTLKCERPNAIQSCGPQSCFLWFFRKLFYRFTPGSTKLPIKAPHTDAGSVLLSPNGCQERDLGWWAE